MNKTEIWEKRLAEQENSGQTRLAWCSNNNIYMSTFRYWKHKLDNTRIPEVDFVELGNRNKSRFTVKASPAIYLEVAGVTNLRKSIDGLASIVLMSEYSIQLYVYPL